MLTAEGTIATERPSRYLVQLCQHAAKIGVGHGHPRVSHAPGEAVGRNDVEVRAEWSETLGTVNFGLWGTCTLQATADALMLRIEAADEENLRQIQGVLTMDVERISRRDELTLHWN
jgi:hypothetical protein